MGKYLQGNIYRERYNIYMRIYLSGYGYGKIDRERYKGRYQSQGGSNLDSQGR